MTTAAPIPITQRLAVMCSLVAEKAPRRDNARMAPMVATRPATAKTLASDRTEEVVAEAEATDP